MDMIGDLVIGIGEPIPSVNLTDIEDQDLNMTRYGAKMCHSDPDHEACQDPNVQGRLVKSFSHFLEICQK